jgi:hypothetical protein
MQVTKPDCQGCAVQQGYVPVETLSAVIKEPAPKSGYFDGDDDDEDGTALLRSPEEVIRRSAEVRELRVGDVVCVVKLVDDQDESEQHARLTAIDDPDAETELAWEFISSDAAKVIYEQNAKRVKGNHPAAPLVGQQEVQPKVVEALEMLWNGALNVAENAKNRGDDYDAGYAGAMAKMARDTLDLIATHPTQQGLDDRDVFERSYAQHAIDWAGIDSTCDEVAQRIQEGRDGNSYAHLHESGAWVGWQLALAAQAKQGGV